MVVGKVASCKFIGISRTCIIKGFSEFTEFMFSRTIASLGVLGGTAAARAALRAEAKAKAQAKAKSSGAISRRDALFSICKHLWR